VWTTHRILRVNGLPPEAEDLVHIFDHDPTADYTLIYGLAGPIIDPVRGRFVIVGQQLVITNHAAGPNLPIIFSLDPSKPAGATITTNGIFRWMPMCDQGSTTNFITLWATDSGNPRLSNSVSFTVTVSECVRVGLGSTTLQVGQNGCVPLNLLSTIGLTNLNFTLVCDSNRFTNWTFSATNPVIGAAEIQALDSAQILFSLGTKAGQVMQGPSVAGQICFGTLPGPSAFLLLRITKITGIATDGSSLGNTFGQSGRVVVIGREPLLEASLAPNGQRMLTLYGNPGSGYQIESNTNLATTDWATAWLVPLTNLFEIFDVNQQLKQVFYRAIEIEANPVLTRDPANAGIYPEH
jgi:hypothetical protein